MATTNIDAVAEFKVLTNAYQAEYGRAVGGQIQVVTKSGTQNFHGSGYWYGRRSDWNANTWIEQARDAGDRTSPRPRATTPATRSAGRSSFPGVQRGQEEAVLLLEPGVPAAHGPGRRAPDARAHRPRAPRRLLAERRQQRQPVPLHPRPPAAGLPCSAADTTRLLPGRRRARPDPAEPPLRARPRRAEHLPDAELLGRQRPQLHRARSPTARRAARTCCGWTSRPRTTGASPAAT